jgi:hypothetical protein
MTDVDLIGLLLVPWWFATTFTTMAITGLMYGVIR